tara:strand:- start:4274 stop:4414 length:141 start_codon:yes stop_codon:yes gene_type:complete
LIQHTFKANKKRRPYEEKLEKNGTISIPRFSSSVDKRAIETMERAG